MAEGAILIATTSALIPFEGREVCIAGGRTTAREGHPILDGREGLFRVLVPDYEVQEPAAKPPEPPAKPPAPAPAAKKPPAPPAQTGPAADAAGPAAAKDGAKAEAAGKPQG